ncbi:DUF4118 domain-containing protein [Mesorhizobium captivum]|uniref:DUF4118 domain-containing protein n=1 Tax=Mesorhizobium captivum TaxID=3072319 RepID=UPI002A244F63|nr:DUF4118 domain-containing protein [Mesorhizobium sp. VK3C]MDX8450321.1 DUF4118 domain-containing protein [Mesorhizobium sp. VK3C]
MADINPNLRQSTTPPPDADPLVGSMLWEAPAAVRYLASAAMTAIATALAVGIDSRVTIPNLSLVFVVPVVLAAVGLGLGPSLCSAVLGALAYNFFLTEPRYTLVVDDPANVWAIALFFVVGLTVSGVAFTSRRRADKAALLRRQAAVLQDYSREVAAAKNVKTIISLTSQALAALFQVPVVLIFFMNGKVVSVDGVGGAEPREVEIASARSSLATGLVVSAGVYPALESRFDFWPVATTAGGPRAAIGVSFNPDERPSAPSTLVDIVARLLVLALDRQHFRDNRRHSAAN